MGKPIFWPAAFVYRDPVTVNKCINVTDSGVCLFWEGFVMHQHNIGHIEYSHIITYIPSYHIVLKN